MHYKKQKEELREKKRKRKTTKIEFNTMNKLDRHRILKMITTRFFGGSY